MNIIKQLKRRAIPPCSKCKWFKEGVLEDECVNPKGLLLYEKLSGQSGTGPLLTWSDRATKYCNYKAVD